MKKLLIFDLDGTLAESKCPLSNDMALLLQEALDHFSIAVISGGSYPQFEKQFLSNLPIPQDKLAKLFLFPTCATSFHRCDRKGWYQIYSQDLTQQQKQKIFDAFSQMFQQVGFSTDNSFGEVLEDRSTQITFSALGQQAPVELKKQWDPDHSKRLQMVNILKNIIPEFEIRTGGSTSIDITRKGVDKAYGIYQIEKLLGFSREEMVFVGDALFDGGNDAPVKTTGVECVQVADPTETMQVIRRYISLYGKENTNS